MDRAIAQRIINEFSEAAYQSYNNNYAYEAGYLQSVILQLLEQVSPSVCMQYLGQFERTAKELKQRQLITTIKEAA